MKATFRCNEELFSLSALTLPQGIQITLAEEKTFTVQLHSRGQGMYLLEWHNEDGIVRHASAAAMKCAGGTVQICFEGRNYLFELEQGSKKPETVSGSLTAPMTGVVSQILAAEGSTAQRGDALLTLEAMKVVAPIEAPFTGVIRSIMVKQGEQVQQGCLLVEMEAENDGG